MAIIGIETLTYGTSDLDASGRFFDDFGLRRDAPRQDGAISYTLPEGSHVVVRDRSDPALPANEMAGNGVCEVIWGVDTEAELGRLAQGLGADHDLRSDADGTLRFITNFGIPMGLRVFRKSPVVCAPDPLNAPGSIRRLNQHRKWRRRALPKTINHVVFAVSDYEAGSAFMRERLNFRLSDSQAGIGNYLRADGTTSHHSFLLLNANAPVPGMDGKLTFHHANFGVEDIDEIMVGANQMTRKGWPPSELGLGRHRIDSALFYYLPCPAGGEAEYGADGDHVDDGWVPRYWPNPLFGLAHFVSNLPPFLRAEPAWSIEYIDDGHPLHDIPGNGGQHA